MGGGAAPRHIGVRQMWAATADGPWPALARSTRHPRRDFGSDHDFLDNPRQWFHRRGAKGFLAPGLRTSVADGVPPPASARLPNGASTGAWDHLLDLSTAERLGRARTGIDVARHLNLGNLEPGMVGVLHAVVSSQGETRSFESNGRAGRLARVTLADGHGEAELVLWGDDVELAMTGPLQPRAAVWFQGLSVKPGYRGGPPELGLVGPIVSAPAAAPDGVIRGALIMGPTTVVTAGPEQRRRAEATVLVPGNPGSMQHVILWGELVGQAMELAGSPLVEISGLGPHPLGDGWWMATAATTIQRPLAS